MAEAFLETGHEGFPRSTRSRAPRCGLSSIFTSEVMMATRKPNPTSSPPKPAKNLKPTKTKKPTASKGTTKTEMAHAEGTRAKKRPAFRNLTSKRINL